MSAINDLSVRCVGYFLDDGADGTPVDMDLGYSLSDQLAVVAVFPLHARSWRFGRDVLIDAIRTGSGGVPGGDIRCRIEASELGQLVVLAMHSPDGTATLAFPVDPIRMLVDNSLLLVPAGDERVDVDAFIARCFEVAS